MIEKININDIPGRNIRYLEVVKDIEDFLAMDTNAVEVKFPAGRNVSSVVASYKKQINLNNYQARVIQRRGRVFLIRKDVEL